MKKSARKDRRTPARPKSEIRQIEKVGYDLVPSRPSRGKRATMNDYAKVTWEPWTRAPGVGPEKLLPSDDTLKSYGVACRAAYAAMFLSRADLIKNVGSADEAIMDKMMCMFAETAEALKFLVLTLDQAYLRTLAAGAAAHVASNRKPRAAGRH